MRSGRPWYGCWDLVAAVSAAITMLGLTIPFFVTQIGSTLRCELNAACVGPSWLTPAAWAAWVSAPIATKPSPYGLGFATTGALLNHRARMT